MAERFQQQEQVPHGYGTPAPGFQQLVPHGYGAPHAEAQQQQQPAAHVVLDIGALQAQPVMAQEERPSIGVHYDSTKKRWGALLWIKNHVRHGHKQKFLGFFDTKQEAQEAYDRAALERDLEQVHIAWKLWHMPIKKLGNLGKHGKLAVGEKVVVSFEAN